MLIRYRVMAYVTATLLSILVFAGIPLQVAAGRPQLVNVVGTIHGMCYIVYLLTAFVLTRSLKVPLGRMVLVLLAGTVPLASILAERKLTKRYHHLVGDDAAVAQHRSVEHPSARSATSSFTSS